MERDENYWRTKLTPDQYRITREKGTEPAFSGQYFDHKEKGSYLCVCCGTKLFHSDDKYDSGTGWPSFVRAVSGQAVLVKDDHSLSIKRTEILCRECDSHLGHVFDDGPAPTRERYCVNSASLDFRSIE